MKLEEIDVGYKRGFFCLAFVYSRNKGNILIKGEQDLVDQKIKDYAPCVANYQRYSNGTATAWWRFVRPGNEYKYEYENPYFPVYIGKPRKPWSSKVSCYSHGRRNKFEFSCTTDNKIITLEFRRIPKTWIPEYNQLLVRKP